MHNLNHKLRQVTLSGEVLSEYKFYVIARAREWRWRFRASNSRIIADSGEGYINKTDCEHGIDLVKKEAPDARIEYL